MITRGRAPRMGMVMAVAILAMLVAAGPGGARPARAQRPPHPPGTVAPLVLNRDLRTLPPSLPGPQQATGRAAGAIAIPGRPPTELAPRDGAMQSEYLIPRPTLTDPFVNIDGIPFTGAVPPDPIGDISPNHYIMMVNSQFAIWDKAIPTPNQLVAPVNINSLWAATGATTPNCTANNAGDPVVRWDALANRWLLSQFTGRPRTQICVAISQTANPVTGGWFLYEFEMGAFPDYFKVGVWPDAYYVSANTNANVLAAALDRTNMLAGAAAIAPIIRSAAGLPGLGSNFMLPSDMDGTALPPANSPNFFYRQVDGDNFGGNDRIELWQFTTDWGTPANSTFTGPTNINLTAFDSAMCGFFSFSSGGCIAQPGTAQLLDPQNEWPMWRFQYRNHGTHQSLLGAFGVDVDGTDRAGIRWFELRRTGVNPWALQQEGTYSPDANHRWTPSIAMDRKGNIALGYSVSSGTVFPSIRYTGRRAGDAAGQMTQGEKTIVAGGASHNSVRWGDYSSMNVDPNDNCTFWYTSMYIAAGSANWRTRVAAFRFPSCLDDLSLAVSAPATVTAGAMLTYTFTVTNSINVPIMGVSLQATLSALLRQIPGSPTTTQGTCLLSSGGQRLGCSLGVINAGATVTVTLTMRVLAPPGSNICINDALVEGKRGVTRISTGGNVPCTRVTSP